MGMDYPYKSLGGVKMKQNVDSVLITTTRARHGPSHIGAPARALGLRMPPLIFLYFLQTLSQGPPNSSFRLI